MQFAQNVSTRVFYMDNGEIYEDGTPEQIFENPRKELTRRFIYRIKVLEIGIDHSSCDLPGAYSQIAFYCVRNRVPPKTEMRIQLVFEELVQQLLITELGKQQIRFLAEYSEADESAAIVVDYNGEIFDPKTAKNELAMTLIRNLSKKGIRTLSGKALLICLLRSCLLRNCKGVSPSFHRSIL